jgi:hypothetical protein
LSRNLFRQDEGPAPAVAAMASYMRREAVRLAAQDAAELLAGRVIFGAPPVGVAASPLLVQP